MTARCQFQTAEVTCRFWTGEQWNYIGFDTVEDYEECMTHDKNTHNFKLVWFKEGRHTI